MNIIVPIDFSENSITALKVANQMASKSNGVLHLVNVFMPMGGTYSILQGINMKKSENIQRALEAQLSELAQKNCHKETQISVIEGDSVEGILYATQKHKGDLIVMGTKGKSNLTNVFMGSNAVAITQKSEVPVITVPYNIKNHEIEKIIYASDFENFSKEYKYLLSLFTEFNWPVEVVHFSEPNSDTSKIKEEFQSCTKEEAQLSIIELPINETLAHSLNKYVDKQENALLVMFTEKRSFLEKLFSKKSQTAQLAYNEFVPLLAIPKIRALNDVD